MESVPASFGAGNQGGIVGRPKPLADKDAVAVLDAFVQHSPASVEAKRATNVILAHLKTISSTKT